MNKIYFIVVMFLSLFGLANEKTEIDSPFNQQEIINDSTGNYSFIVSGHFHGSGNNRTGYPTNTLLANLNWINSSDNSMLISLGDLFLDVSNDIPQYKKSLFSQLKLPMFNAVGNHDLTGSIYQDNFGETFYYWQINNDIHVVLDTELDDGSLKDEQKKMLENVNTLTKSGSISNVFIYSHRTIWAKTYTELDLLFQDNTQAILGNNFESEVLPLLKEIKLNSNVFWFSGSLGSAPASFFQFKDKNDIQYIATAIRGLPRDAVLIVNVNKKGNVSFETKSFTNQKLMPFENYNVNFWNENVGKKEPFNFRLIPFYIKQNLLNHSFWYGFTIMLMISLIFYWRKRKKA